jgi:hypothetical protein
VGAASVDAAAIVALTPARASSIRSLGRLSPPVSFYSARSALSDMSWRETSPALAAGDAAKQLAPAFASALASSDSVEEGTLKAPKRRLLSCFCSGS